MAGTSKGGVIILGFNTSKVGKERVDTVDNMLFFYKIFGLKSGAHPKFGCAIL